MVAGKCTWVVQYAKQKLLMLVTMATTSSTLFLITHIIILTLAFLLLLKVLALTVIRKLYYVLHTCTVLDTTDNRCLFSVIPSHTPSPESYGTIKTNYIVNLPSTGAKSNPHYVPAS